MEFIQDKVSMAKNLLFVFFVTPQPKQTHHLNCLIYRHSASFNLVISRNHKGNCLQEEKILQFLYLFFLFCFQRTVCRAHTLLSQNCLCTRQAHLLEALRRHIFIVVHCFSWFQVRTWFCELVAKYDLQGNVLPSNPCVVTSIYRKYEAWDIESNAMYSAFFAQCCTCAHKACAHLYKQVCARLICYRVLFQRVLL